jgi:tripartite-type tricarboxylate transporter receptor subunit TctC
MPPTPRTETRLAPAPRWALAVALLGASMSAASFPTQPVRMLIGAAPGSSPDVVTRLLGEAMASSLGQPVIVENRVGAGGTIATAAVAAAAPDGHTLNVSGCSGDAITHAFVSQGRTPLRLFKDLTPVGRLLLDHWLVLVPASSGMASLSDLARKAQEAADPVAYPSQGEGSTPHLQGERLARSMGFKALHVPYKDSPINDLVGGRLAYAVLPSAAAVPLVKAGRLKALAVLSAERLAALPDVPTAEQAGLAGYRFNGGLCLWAPGATPSPVIVRLNASLSAAARQSAVGEKMQALGADPTPFDLEITAQYVRDFAAESDRLRAAVFGSAR